MKCRTCEHPRQRDLNKELARGRSPADVARRYGLPPTSVRRHVDDGHLGELVAEALRDKRICALADLDDAVRATVEECIEIMRSTNDPDVKLRAIGKQHAAIELVGKLTNQIQGDKVQALLLAVGLASLAELKAAAEIYRASSSMSAEEAREEAVATLQIIYLARPEWLDADLARLESVRRRQLVAGNGSGAVTSTAVVLETPPETNGTH